MPQDTPYSSSSPHALAGASGHNPALDGVRGLAILLVMWHHNTVFHPSNWVEQKFAMLADYGGAGVDLFFALSGFLITGILYDSKVALAGAPKQYFTNFYARRTLRIFPLYYAVVAMSLLVLPHARHFLQYMVGPDTVRLIQGKLDRFDNIAGYEHWFWLYLSNFPIAYSCKWLHGILGVSWSLAIEEQFYLVWPMLVWFVSRKAAITTCTALMFAAFVCRTLLAWRMLDAQCGYGHHAEQYLPWANPIGVYVLTFCRMDDLALGALVALLLRGSVSVGQAAAWCKPVALICLPGALLLSALDVKLGLSNPDMGAATGPLFQTAGFTLLGLGCVSMLVLAIAARPGGLWNRCWTNRLLRTFGKYAYALYLFHLPIRAAIRDIAFGPPTERGAGPWIQFPRVFQSEFPAQIVFYVVSIAVALLAAWISWQIFESQFLKLKRYFPSGIEKPCATSGRT